MKKIFLSCALAALGIFQAGAASAQTPQAAATQGGDATPRPARQRVVGEVTAVDASNGRIIVKTDAGESVPVATDAKTAFLRLPPGETALDKAAHVAAADVHIGDRVLAVGVPPTGGATPARQLILMGRAASAGAQAFDPSKRLNGRIASLDASKKQIVVQSRGRDGAETITLDASGSSARLLHYAPDSARTADAQPITFADLKVGDQIRATGERSADGKSFRADEIVAGSLARFFGQITSVDAARGEVTLKNGETGQAVTVALGQRTTLRRVTPEFVKTMTERFDQAQQRREQRANAGASGQATAGGAQGAGGGQGAGRRREGGAGGGQRGAGPDGQRRGGGAGGPGGFEQMFDSLPAITAAELKKGDAAQVTATPGADASHVTAVMLITGDADFMRRMAQARRGGGPQRGRVNSPGLPGDALGGGNGGGSERVPPPPRQ